MTHVLYVSYDGLLEPLGESQVVNYVERLATEHGITLLSFEKAEDLADSARVSAMTRRLGAHDIAWLRLRYHKRPAVLSTALDIAWGALRARAVCRRRSVRIIHARGYVSSLIALAARGASRAAFLFDMRGFWIDEKVEAGHWRAGGLLYRVAKWWEARFFAGADAVVVLTQAGVRALPELGYDVPPSVPIKVIPTCVDLERFRPLGRDAELVERLGLTGARVVGCVGTISNWYMRAEMLRYLALVARSLPHARVLMVTREDHEALRRDAVAAGIPSEQLVLVSAPFEDMPRFIRLFDVGIFFIRPVLSKRASAATKLAEFLASGVPVVINDGVGDSGSIVREGRVGLVLDSLSPVSFHASIGALQAMLADDGMWERCRDTARRLFDVESGVVEYRNLYDRLTVGEHP